jgi:hypothetical protein
VDVVSQMLTGVWTSHGAATQPLDVARASRPPAAMMRAVAASAARGASTSQAPPTSATE